MFLNQNATRAPTNTSKRTRERVPLDWATTKNNLGLALSILGERESSLERLRQAKDTLQSAHTVYREAGLSQCDAYFEERLNTFDQLIEELEGY